MTLRSKAFFASLLVAMVFMLSGALFYYIQHERVNTSEASVIRLVSQAVATSIKRYQEKALLLLDEQRNNADDPQELNRLATRFNADFTLRTAPDGKVIWWYSAPSHGAKNPEVDPMPDESTVSRLPFVYDSRMIEQLAIQLAGLTGVKNGVVFVDQTPLYVVMQRDPSSQQLWVAGVAARELFRIIQDDYPLNVQFAFDQSNRTMDEHTSRVRGVVKLPGVLSNPVNVWVEDPTFIQDIWQLKLFIWIGLGIVMGIFLWWVWHSHFILPMQNIIDQAQNINAKQEFERRIVHDGDDELHELTAHYNSVISTLEYSYNLMMKSNLVTTELMSRVKNEAAAEPSQPVPVIVAEDNVVKYSLDMVNRLSDAINNNVIELYFQPVFDIESRNVTQVEATCRWLDTERGMVPPLDFFALAEKSGQMEVLTQQIVRLACSALQRWQGVWPKDVALSINISLSQFEQPNFITIVSDALSDYSIKPFQLEFELKEYTISEGMESAAGFVNALHDLNVGVCIDDFGLSQFSLISLQRLPISKIKLSKSFVDRLDSSPDESAFIDGIARFCEGLKVRAIAKGVQSEQQLYALRKITKLDCQGYALAKPMPATEFGEWLANRSGDAPTS